MTKSGKLRAALIGVVLAALGGRSYLFWFSGGDDSKSPQFKAQRPDGTLWASSSLAGRPAIVHFWATWCPPCKTEIRDFLDMARSIKGRVQFVAISQDKKWDEVFAMVPRAEWPPEVILVLDPKSEIGEQFGTFQLPETYALGADGSVLRKWVGPQEWGVVKGQLGK